MTYTIGSDTFTIHDSNQSVLPGVNASVIRTVGDNRGTLEAKDFHNCPFCVTTEHLTIEWEKSMTKNPPYEYIFDVTLLCTGCGIFMDENGLSITDALSSLQSRWNKRPKRDDFSAELFKARMYDKQEKWNQEELAKYGPFSLEDMEAYFDKSIFELAAALSSIKHTNELLGGEVESCRKRIAYLEEYIRMIQNGNGSMARQLENTFYGSGSLGSAYYGVGEPSYKITNISMEEYAKRLNELGRSMGAAAGEFMNGISSMSANISDALRNAEPEFRKALASLDTITDEQREKLLADLELAKKEMERKTNTDKAYARSVRNQASITERKRRGRNR